MQRLYVMALYATRPTPEETEDAAEADEHEVSLRVAMTVAESDEEARRKGLAQVRAWCPPYEGWVNHHVTLNIVPKEALKNFYETISDDPPEPKDRGDDQDWPDLIM